ncbi:MAG: hypothetical protein ACI4QR_03985, partial [Eubacteriales bacterium]
MLNKKRAAARFSLLFTLELSTFLYLKEKWSKRTKKACRFTACVQTLYVLLARSDIENPPQAV